LTRKNDRVKKLLLVRHAEPLMRAEMPGAEWPLTETGRMDANGLGARLATKPPTVIWTSPERRARETAALAFPSMAAEMRIQLSEVNKPWYASSDEHANAVIRYLKGQAVAGWEHHEAVVSRIIQLKADFGSFDNLVLVSHGLFITTLLDHEIGLNDPFSFWSSLRMPDAWELNLDLMSVDRIQ
jgi:broad specificity phosphatase PhoE